MTSRAAFMMTFDQLLSHRTWNPLRGCPGRFVLASASERLEPHHLVAGAVRVLEFRVAAARDVVVVVPLDRGGLISYRRDNGTYVHTLNSPDGFHRKLQQLGIPMPEAKGVGSI